MPTVSYGAARERLAELRDRIEDTREEIILSRRGYEEIALLPASELGSLKETVHLLRSPRNAARLLAALARSRGEPGIECESVHALAAGLGLRAAAVPAQRRKNAAG